MQDSLAPFAHRPTDRPTPHRPGDRGVQPGGNRIATGGRDDTIWLWPAVATPEMLCDKLTTNMSHQQWRDWVSPDIDYVTLCPGLPVP